MLFARSVKALPSITPIVLINHESVLLYWPFHLLSATSDSMRVCALGGIYILCKQKTFTMMIGTKLKIFLLLHVWLLPTYLVSSAFCQELNVWVSEKYFGYIYGFI